MKQPFPIEKLYLEANENICCIFIVTSLIYFFPPCYPFPPHPSFISCFYPFFSRDGWRPFGRRGALPPQRVTGGLQMSGTLPILIPTLAALACHLDAPTCPLRAPQSLATRRTRSRRLVSMPAATRPAHGARSAETEGGQCVPERVSADGASRQRGGGVGGGFQTWAGSGREGGRKGGAQSEPLAFTGSPRIAKFFSNLQLLDVGANHQRGSPRAYPPPPHHHHRSPTTTTATHPPPNPKLPSYPPPESRLIQASSLIHVFIYYFIGCACAG